MGDFMRSRGIFQNGIPLTRGQVNPGRPWPGPPGASKSENSLVFVGPERFWRSGWRRLAVGWLSTGRPGLPNRSWPGPAGVSQSENELVFVGRERFYWFLWCQSDFERLAGVG